MNRRDFLRSAGAVSASLAFPKTECLLAEDATLWQLAHVRSDNARRNPEVFRGNARVAAGGAHQRDAFPEDALQ